MRTQLRGEKEVRVFGGTTKRMESGVECEEESERRLLDRRGVPETRRPLWVLASHCVT